MGSEVKTTGGSNQASNTPKLQCGHVVLLCSGSGFPPLIKKNGDYNNTYVTDAGQNKKILVKVLNAAFDTINYSLAVIVTTMAITTLKDIQIAGTQTGLPRHFSASSTPTPDKKIK